MWGHHSIYHTIILMNNCFVPTLEIASIFVTCYLMATQRDVALHHETFEFD